VKTIVHKKKTKNKLLNKILIIILIDVIPQDILKQYNDFNKQTSGFLRGSKKNDGGVELFLGTPKC
jgi:hypothetical protein